jgi:hypothetical protein
MWMLLPQHASLCHERRAMHLRRLSVPTRAAQRDGQAAHSEKRIWILLAASCVLFAQRHLCNHELHCTFAAPMMRIQEAYR